MRLQLPLESNAQFSKPRKPAMRAFDNPAVSAKARAAFNAFASNAADDSQAPEVVSAALVVITLVSMQLGRSAARATSESFDGRHLSNSIESWQFKPLTSITRGTPRASTTMCRLEPSLPVSVGLGPVCGPPGGLVATSRQRSLGSNQSGRPRANAPGNLSKPRVFEVCEEQTHFTR